MIRFRGIVAALLIGMLLTGCGAKAPTADKPKTSAVPSSNTNADSQIKLVKKAQKTKYLLSNGIEIERLQKVIKTSKGDINIQIPQVSGLIDKNLEGRINKAILEDIGKETKNYADEADKIENTYFYCETEVNANNILSLVVREPVIEGVGTAWYGATYRLTDGKQLSLRDIFTEGTDYVTLLNREVSKGIIRQANSEDEAALLTYSYTTIKPDQDFVLSDSELDIVFHPGEGGFKKRTTISIPLSEIDDYIWVMDIYSGTERKTQEKQNLIVRYNNIFTTKKSEVVRKKNGDLLLQYFEVSGLRDDSFQKVINKKIKDSISEVVNGKYFDSLKKNPNRQDDSIASIEITPAFNSYGILTFQRYVYDGDVADPENDFDYLSKHYSFDLINKKPVEVKDILKNNFKKYPGSGDALAELVKKELKTHPYVQNLEEFNKAVDSNIDYSFIMDKGIVDFMQNRDSTDIAISFKGDALKGSWPYGVTTWIPIKDVINITPQEFFGG